MSEYILKMLSSMRESPGNVRFKDLCKVCEHYFGKPRQRGTNHRIYRTPWAGDPRINIQESRGMAKVYQIKQVLAAIDRLENKHEPSK
jgi:hypothetical protein